jgi:hypothetical protein
MGWVWSGGSGVQLCPWAAAGFGLAGDPETGTGAGSSAPPPYRQLRVFSAHRPGPQLQVQDSVMGVPRWVDSSLALAPPRR